MEKENTFMANLQQEGRVELGTPAESETPVKETPASPPEGDKPKEDAPASPAEGEVKRM